MMSILEKGSGLGCPHCGGSPYGIISIAFNNIVNLIRIEGNIAIYRCHHCYESYWLHVDDEVKKQWKEFGWKG